MPADTDGPFWLVNRLLERHTGPFSSRFDAALAANLAASARWEPLSREEFNQYLETTR